MSKKLDFKDENRLSSNIKDEFSKETYDDYLLEQFKLYDRF